MYGLYEVIQGQEEDIKKHIFEKKILIAIILIENLTIISCWLFGG